MNIPGLLLLAGILLAIVAVALVGGRNLVRRGSDATPDDEQALKGGACCGFALPEKLLKLDSAEGDPNKARQGVHDGHTHSVPH